MKKSIVNLIFISLLILGIFHTISSIKAEDSLADTAQGAVDTAIDTSKIIADEQTRSEFLKAKWAEFISTSPLGKIFGTFGSFLEFFNPLFKIIPGVEFSWSKLFITSIVLAVSLFIFSYRMSSSHFINKKYFNLGIALAVLLLLSITKILYFISDKIVRLTELTGNLLSEILIWAILLVAIVYFLTFSKIFRGLRAQEDMKRRVKNIEEKIKESKKEEETEEQKLGKAAVEEIGKTLKELDSESED